MPMIHNRGKDVGGKHVARKIVFPLAWDKDGRPAKDGKLLLEDTLTPGQHKMVTDEQFQHLRDNFHDEIINIEDIKEMQAQFKAATAAKPREGYVAPEDVDALVAKKVAETLAKNAADIEDAKSQTTESREDLIARIDAMDRGDLIALIEKEGLGIDHKTFKAPGTLKAAVLTALENKDAAKAAA